MAFGKTFTALDSSESQTKVWAFNAGTEGHCLQPHLKPSSAVTLGVIGQQQDAAQSQLMQNLSATP
jgi:hypothetical protein